MPKKAHIICVFVCVCSTCAHSRSTCWRVGSWRRIGGTQVSCEWRAQSNSVVEEERSGSARRRQTASGRQRHTAADTASSNRLGRLSLCCVQQSRKRVRVRSSSRLRWDHYNV